MSDGSTFRQDIQALRGIAVLLVLLFHAKIGGFAAGYLGVDVFFVLSGYLMTGLVNRRLAENRFSFASFYLDRAKRLLPAAYVVYGATAIAAYWLLAWSEFDRLLLTLWGALTFTANISLWMSTDYFTPSAKFNALLHVWSLSIEEQFYFLLPLALFLTPGRLRLALVGVGGVVSLALCLYLVPKSPVFSFFLLPTRAWELALGGALALAEARRSAPWVTVGAKSRMHSSATVALGYIALAILLLIPAFSMDALLGSRHPGLDAILICAATGLLLVLRSPLLSRGPVSLALARLGGISYSLYLVHWPLFAFATNAYVGETPPLEVRVGLLLVSVLLAFLLFAFVEQPIRRRRLDTGRWRPALTVLAATAMVVVLAGGLRMARMVNAADLPDRSANHGLSKKCEFDDRFEPLPDCASGPAPDTLIWGDSFAMHLAPGLAAMGLGDIQQATKSQCGPIAGLAPAWPTVSYGLDWSTKCNSFNSSVLNHIAQSPNVKRVIVSSVFSQYVQEAATGLFEGDQSNTARTYSLHEFAERFSQTVQRIQALEKEVIIVGPAPATGFDIGLCHERKAVGVLVLGMRRDCQLDVADSHALRARQMNVLREVAAETGAHLVDLAKYLCDDKTCRTEIDGVPLYWDAGHFSAAGSRKVMAATGVGAAILDHLGGNADSRHRAFPPL